MQLSLPRFFDRNSNTDTRPYRLGICLSGGGARGFAHIGALKAITEVGLQPDIIAGVSAGAMAATLFSAGVPLDEVVPLFAEKNSPISHLWQSATAGDCSNSTVCVNFW